MRVAGGVSIQLDSDYQQGAATDSCQKEEFDGSPAYELYITGAEEIDYHLKNNPVEITEVKSTSNASGTFAETDMLARSISVKVSQTSFETVQVALERAASTEALSL